MTLGATIVWRYFKISSEEDFQNIASKFSLAAGILAFLGIALHCEVPLEIENSFKNIFILIATILFLICSCTSF